MTTRKKLDAVGIGAGCPEEFVGQGQLRLVTAEPDPPAQREVVPSEYLDVIVRRLVESVDTWRREALVTIVGHRLADLDCAELAATRDFGRLVELLGDTGAVSPETVLRLLAAEGAELGEAVALVPTLGLPLGDAIRVMHEQWGADRVTVGRSLGASPSELRSAGCTPQEILASGGGLGCRPIEARPGAWDTVGPTLIEGGRTLTEAVHYLAVHAPTPAAFACAMSTVVESPVEALALTGRDASVDFLVALTEYHGLDCQETASALASACVPPEKAVAVLAARSGGDMDATAALSARHLGLLAAETMALVCSDATGAVCSLGTRIELC